MFRFRKLNKVFKSVMLRLALLLILSLALVSDPGCETTPNISTPLLPSGFTDALVPDVNLDGYLYLNQSSPVVISSDLMKATGPQISVRSAQLFLGPDTDSIGGSVSFQSQADAQLAVQLMKSITIPLWSLANGNIIYAANTDSGDWTSSVKNAFSQQQMVNPSAKFPETREDFAYFPSNPPSKPIVAGFVNTTGNLVDSIGTRTELSLTDYTSVLKSAGISRISFVVYCAKPITISSKTLSEAYIDSLQVSALAVGRSSYPSIAVSAFFDTAIESAGFTKYTINNVDMFEYPLGNAEIAAGHKGNVIYVAVSPSKDLVEKLLLSCF